MYRMSKLAKYLATGTLAVTLAAPAAAQDDDRDWRPGWGMGRMMPGWGWGNGPMMGFGPDAMLDRIDGRLAFLKTELKITDAQSAAWDEMADTIRTTAAAHNSLMQSMMEQMHDGGFAEMPLPERLALHESHLEAQLEQIRELKAAVEKLHTVLEDDQKKAADEILLPTMGMGMTGIGMMGGGYGMGPWMMNR